MTVIGDEPRKMQESSFEKGLRKKWFECWAGRSRSRRSEMVNRDSRMQPIQDLLMNQPKKQIDASDCVATSFCFARSNCMPRMTRMESLQSLEKRVSTTSHDPSCILHCSALQFPLLACC